MRFIYHYKAFQITNIYIIEPHLYQNISKQASSQGYFTYAIGSREDFNSFRTQLKNNKFKHFHYNSTIYSSDHYIFMHPISYKSLDLRNSMNSLVYSPYSEGLLQSDFLIQLNKNETFKGLALYLYKLVSIRTSRVQFVKMEIDNIRYMEVEFPTLKRN